MKLSEHINNLCGIKGLTEAEIGINENFDIVNLQEAHIKLKMTFVKK